MRTTLILLLLMLMTAGCRESAQPIPTTAPNDAQINLNFDPDPPQVGEAILIVTLTDAGGESIEAQSVTVRGDMTHAGMMPVIGEPAQQAEDGTYRIPFNWSMGGDWMISVDVTLADGSEISREFELTVES